MLLGAEILADAPQVGSDNLWESEGLQNILPVHMTILIAPTGTVPFSHTRGRTSMME